MSTRGTKPGDKHFSASVFIISTDSDPKVLLVYHRKSGTWMQPGGHVERGENPIETVIREVKEETGLDIGSCFTVKKLNKDVLILPVPDFLQQHIILAHGDEPRHFHIDHEYVVRIERKELQPRKQESQDVGWFTRNRVADLKMFNNVRYRVEELFKTCQEDT